MVMARKPTQTTEEPQTEAQSITPAAQKEKEKPTGRPSKYTPEIARHICEQLSEGIPLREICREEGMPAWRTIYDWMGRSEDLSAAIMRARDVGYDKMAEECLEIADDANNDWMEKLDQHGKSIGWQINGEHVQRSKLRIETRLKLLAKFHPTKYGEKANKVEEDDPAKTNREAKALLREVIKNIEQKRQNA